MLVVSGCAEGADRPGPTAEAVRATATPAASPLPGGSAGPAACFDRGPGDYVEAVERPEGERTYRVHVPPSYDGREPLPVVFNFHGQGRTAEHQDEYSGLREFADSAGFILVTPQGLQNQWNIRDVFGDETIDDAGTVAAILERVEAGFCTDAGRVFATGLSNGAEMASQVGCFLADRFAAIAPVAGIVFQQCEGGPVAVLTFHGTADFNVPYDSALEAVPQWAAHNGCSEPGDQSRVGEHVLVQEYRGCSAPVVFVTLEGAGHTWPGAEDGAGGVGSTNHEISANEVMWAFFSTVTR